MYVCIYIYIYIYISLSLYIYIYIERERERDVHILKDLGHVGGGQPWGRHYSSKPTYLKRPLSFHASFIMPRIAIFEEKLR